MLRYLLTQPFYKDRQEHTRYRTKKDRQEHTKGYGTVWYGNVLNGELYWT